MATPRTIKRLHWCGPYGVYVPCGIKSVAAVDGHNTMTRDGFSTQVGYMDEDGEALPSLTRVQYRSKFAVRRGSHWFYDISRLSAEERASAFVMPDEVDTAFYMVRGKRARKMNEHPLFAGLRETYKRDAV